MPTAKCDGCKIRFLWDAAPLVRNALCPRCSRRLTRTSYESKFKVREEQPGACVEASVRALALLRKCEVWLSPEADWEALSLVLDNPWQQIRAFFKQEGISR